MTDKEIIKAIEYCKNYEGNGCRGCVLYGNEKGTCIDELLTNALDLINSQQAEIEAWKKINQRLYDEMEERRKEDIGIAKIYARIGAIKEFAERLKGKFAIFQYVSYSAYSKIISIIDNLVKEMVGEQE